MEITKKLLAAYAKGNVSEEERLAVRAHISENPANMQTVFGMLDDMYKDLEQVVCPKDNPLIDSPGHADYTVLRQNLEKLSGEVREKSRVTMLALAADNTIDNLCDIRCEGYALRKLGIEISDGQLEEESQKNEWLTEDGTRLADIGKLCELHGAKVSRQLESSLDDILSAIEKNQIVLVSVDEGELVGNLEAEKSEDQTIGKRPDHVVIVVGYDDEKREISIIDPNTPQTTDNYSLDQFMDAWDDSYNYMVSISL